MTAPAQASSTPAISVAGLGKAYGSVVAIDGLDLEIASGELVAVLGPNGAGKTSTVEILEGYRRPDRGRVLVLGMDPVRDARRLRPLVGLMLQEGGVYPTLKVRETLALFAGFFAEPVPPAVLLERLGLGGRAEARFRQLSGGEKQRLSLGLALVGRPRVLFLDEPTSGMDPRGRLLTWEVIEESRRDGVTVVLTTHAMEEAERLADRVAILSRGRLVACDSPARLRSTAGSELIQLELDRELDPGLLAELLALGPIRSVEPAGQARYRLRSPDPRAAMAAVTGLLRERGPQVTLLQLGRSSLEELFLELTEADR